MSKIKSLAVESICYRMGQLNGQWAAKDAQDRERSIITGEESFYRRIIRENQESLEVVVETAREGCDEFDRDQIDENARKSYVRGMRTGASLESARWK